MHTQETIEKSTIVCTVYNICYAVASATLFTINIRSLNCHYSETTLAYVNLCLNQLRLPSAC